MGQFGGAVALLQLELPPDLFGGQAGVQPLGAKAGIGLTLSLHQIPEIIQ